MTLKRILKKGKLNVHPKSLMYRLRLAIENSAKPTFGGIQIADFKYRFPVALFYVLMFASFFIGLVSISITSQQTPFISAQYEGGGLKCSEISKNVIGAFVASYSGIWQSMGAYKQNEQVFKFSFNGGAITDEDYRAAIMYFKEKTTLLTLRETKPSLLNLIILSVMGLVHPATQIKFELATDPAYIFSTLVQIAVLSNIEGVCVGNTKHNTFISGGFNQASAGLRLTIPFALNSSAVFGKDVSMYRRDLKATTEETCPKHGPWVNGFFQPAYSESRKQSGDLEFDVRSTFLAIALNMHLAGTSSLTPLKTPYLDKIGMVGWIDPYYKFPIMQRIYCINKGSDVWKQRLEFTKEEIEDQARGFINPANEYEYPQICFISSSIKGSYITLFYPIVNQLKFDRPYCYDTNTCPKGPSPTVYKMKVCECPRDAISVDCNRQSIYVGYLYPTGLRGDAKTIPEYLSKNKLIDFGYEMYQDIKTKMALKPNAEGKLVITNENFDTEYLDTFKSIFQASIRGERNPLGNDIKIQDMGDTSGNEESKTAWSNLGSRGLGKELSAVIFRSVMVQGGMGMFLPLNENSVQMTDLIKGDATYLEPNADIYLKAPMCQTPFDWGDAFDLIASMPPVPLIESYYKCTKNNPIIILGSSYSTAMLMSALIWSVVGWLFIKVYKDRMKKSGSPETLMGSRAKDELADVYGDLKDEALVACLQSFRERISALEGHTRSVSEDEGMPSECDFDMVYRPGNEVEVGAELTKRIDTRIKYKEVRMIDKLDRVAARLSYSSSKQFSVSQHPAFTSQRWNNDADGDGNEMRKSPLEDDHILSRRSSVKISIPADSAASTNDPSSAPHELDATVAAAARRMSQRLSIANPIVVHARGIQLSDMSPAIDATSSPSDTLMMAIRRQTLHPHPMGNPITSSSSSSLQAVLNSRSPPQPSDHANRRKL